MSAAMGEFTASDPGSFAAAGLLLVGAGTGGGAGVGAGTVAAIRFTGTCGSAGWTSFFGGTFAGVTAVDTVLTTGRLVWAGLGTGGLLSTGATTAASDDWVKLATAFDPKNQRPLPSTIMPAQMSGILRFIGCRGSSSRTTGVGLAVNPASSRWARRIGWTELAV